MVGRIFNCFVDGSRILPFPLSRYIHRGFVGYDINFFKPNFLKVYSIEIGAFVTNVLSDGVCTFIVHGYKYRREFFKLL